MGVISKSVEKFAASMKVVIPATAVLVTAIAYSVSDTERSFEGIATTFVAALLLSTFVWAVLVVLVGILGAILSLITFEDLREEMKARKIQEYESKRRHEEYVAKRSQPIPMTFHGLIFGETMSEARTGLHGFDVVGEEDGRIYWKGTVSGEPATVLGKFTPISGLLYELIVRIEPPQHALEEVYKTVEATLVNRYGPRTETLLRSYGDGGDGVKWQLLTGEIACVKQRNSYDEIVVLRYEHKIYKKMAESEQIAVNRLKTAELSREM